MADNHNLILYHPESAKVRRLHLGFSWLFFLLGVFGFFFRGLFKDGLLWLAGLTVLCSLFDNEVGSYPLLDFKYVGYAVGITLAIQGNFYCLQKWMQQGYRLDRTSPLAAAWVLKDKEKFFKNVRYAEIKEELEKIAAQGQF